MSTDRIAPHRIPFASAFVGVGVVIPAAAILLQSSHVHWALLFGGIMMLLAYPLVSGQSFKGIGINLTKDTNFRVFFEKPERIEPKTISKDEKEEKEKFAANINLPGQNAPKFSALSLNLLSDLLIRPSAHPMTPMYLLDNAFRILDWNQAFTIAFDRTMEGRQGLSVLEWTYFLDNYQQVLRHGEAKFNDKNKPPLIDVETIEYTSLRYGKLTATKRAYQVPDDAEDCLAWLVTLDLKFADPAQQIAYHQDLIRQLGFDLMWSEYSISYDRLLNNTRVYPELLDNLIGAHDGVAAIPQEARILDLGAGTGNLAHKLITTGRDRLIVAVENNRMMLQHLRAKCQRFLRSDLFGGGVFTIKQDITSLLGLDDEYFDYVTMNNVLYAVDDAEGCLRDACRVLKPGGELRLSGPRRDTNLDALFDRIVSDLKESNKLSELKDDLQRVEQINRLRLKPLLYRWTTKEVEEMLLKAGFSKILYSSEQYYAGQSMLICAAK